jgi:hypothetical protein
VFEAEAISSNILSKNHEQRCFAVLFDDAQYFCTSLDDDTPYVAADVFDRMINSQFDHTLSTNSSFSPMSVRIVRNARENGFIARMRHRLGTAWTGPGLPEGKTFGR